MTPFAFSGDLFKKHHLPFFIAASLCIHIALGLSLSAGTSSSSIKRHELFDVDLVAPRKQEPEKIKVPAEYHPDPSDVIREKQPVAKDIKKISPQYADAPISRMPGEKEATVSLDAAAQKPSKYDRYLRHLRSRINAVWEYPEEAKKHRLSGMLTLRFTIRHNGGLIDVRLVQPSGHDLLDREAVRTIHDAAPFDPLPARLGLERLNVLASFDYEFSPE